MFDKKTYKIKIICESTRAVTQRREGGDCYE
jgi:hypothetical protein